LNPATEQCYNGVVLPKPVSKSPYNYTFNDVQFWVGEGSNRAMFIVLWPDGKIPVALAWGYKWNGEKHGVDMVFDIAKVDSRLFVLGEYTGPLGVAIGGIGYNINGNSIQLKDPNGNLHTPVNGGVDGVGYNYDGWTCTDPSAHWNSGWYGGYWSYWVSDNGPNSQWYYSNLGASSRPLVNNSVDAWWFDTSDIWEDENGSFMRCMMFGEDCDGKEFFGNIGNITSAINYTGK
jgi:hypothetical protein